ncbi:uncharacterized protein LOC100369405 [Saccoglossus kowalevskii]|uniref:Zinc finger protein 16-like n=1 Tax=Saccoglossus kowalevskii TaxID=10224 RepID=A0ABM0GJR5_SACKO|nr:PREDICTED: zinc finger protein 16-like [Saccoglossus kowalevskii]
MIGKELMKRAIFQQGHAFALMTGCKIFIRIDDLDENNTSSHCYASRQLLNEYCHLGLKCDMKNHISVDGETGQPINNLCTKNSGDKYSYNHAESDTAGDYEPEDFELHDTDEYSVNDNDKGNSKVTEINNDLCYVKEEENTNYLCEQVSLNRFNDNASSDQVNLNRFNDNTSSIGVDGTHEVFTGENIVQMKDSDCVYGGGETLEIHIKHEGDTTNLTCKETKQMNEVNMDGFSNDIEQTYNNQDDISERNTSLDSFIEESQEIALGAMLLQCIHCNHTFDSKQQLDKHLVTKHSDRPYICHECGETFKKFANLKQHRNVHAGLKPFSCDVCGRKFARSSHLKGHRYTHENISPYKCEICNTFFTNSYNVKRHMLRHGGERPYQCSICCHTFYRRDQLLAHERSHVRKMKKQSVSLCH